MPVYEAKCNQCGALREYIRPVAQYDDTPMCCGEKTEKVILSSPMAVMDIQPYQSPVTGKWIDSRKQRNEDMKRNSCRPWEGIEQEKKEARRARQYEDQALAKQVDKWIKEDFC